MTANFKGESKHYYRGLHSQPLLNLVLLFCCLSCDFLHCCQSLVGKLVEAFLDNSALLNKGHSVKHTLAQLILVSCVIKVRLKALNRQILKVCDIAEGLKVCFFSIMSSSEPG